MIDRPGLTSAAALILITAGVPAQPGCGWAPGPLALPGTDGPIHVQAVLDDGTGPALYIGGAFRVAGRVNARGIVRRRAGAFSPMGEGFDGAVRALARFDGFPEPGLVAAGCFTASGTASIRNIARWSGLAWEPLGTGTDGEVLALIAHDDGSGSALYAAGRFTEAGGAPAAAIARWNGSAWQPVGGGFGGGSTGQPVVRALAVYDGGSGPELHATGDFSSAGGVACASIARWNGTSWSPLGSGLTATFLSPSGSALAVYDNGSGPELIAGGSFDRAGGTSAVGAARWNGASWAPLAPGIPGMLGGEPLAFAVLDEGSGPALHACGLTFIYAGGSFANIVRWSGSQWTSFAASGLSPVRSLAAFDDGAGPRLFAGGGTMSSQGTSSVHLMVRDGSAWTEPAGPCGSRAGALAVHDDGTGPALFIGTERDEHRPGPGVWKWDGAVATAIGAPCDGVVCALLGFDDGAGPALYAGGRFGVIGGVPAGGIARWDGSSWSPAGVIGSACPIEIVDLVVFDGGQGSKLHAGVRTQCPSDGSVLRWDGGVWTDVGLWGSDVRDLAVFDDGYGDRLHAAGSFVIMDPPGTLRPAAIIRWDGSSWSALHPTVPEPFDFASALAIHDHGNGPRLHAVATLPGAGAGPSRAVLQWSGSGWSALGTISGGADLLGSFDAGPGPELFVAGTDLVFGGRPPSSILRWDGGSWSPLGAGPGGPAPVSVSALGAWRGELWAAGSFSSVDGVASPRVARFGCGGPDFAITQPGGAGEPVFVSHVRLAAGGAYWSLFSSEPCVTGPGGGPWLGLCASDPSILVAQFQMPLGAAPFHFLATSSAADWGPFPLSPMTVEGIVLAIDGGAWRASPVRRFAIH